MYHTLNRCPSLPPEHRTASTLCRGSGTFHRDTVLIRGRPANERQQIAEAGRELDRRYGLAVEIDLDGVEQRLRQGALLSPCCYRPERPHLLQGLSCLLHRQPTLVQRCRCGQPV